MRVLSALGAPFKADVEVTNLRSDEEGNMLVRVAQPELFKQAGIDYNPALANINATLNREGAFPTIVLSSAAPINEPLLEVLLEMSWQSGRLVRQYTVLLDPVNPVTDSASSNDTVQAPVSQLASTASAQSQGTQNNTEQATTKVSQSSASGETTNNNYDVRRGDTLFNIASRLSGGDLTKVNALMAILLQNNPHAFEGNNINRLKSGVVLNTTGAGQVADLNKQGFASGSTSGAAAVQGGRKFDQYKQRAAKKSKKLSNKKSSDKSVKNTVKADAPSKPSAVQDQLKVSGNAAVVNQKTKQTKQISQNSDASNNASKEQAIAKNRAIAEEKAKIAELEKNIKQSTAIKNSVITSPQANTSPTSPTSPISSSSATSTQPALKLSSAPAPVPATTTATTATAATAATTQNAPTATVTPAAPSVVPTVAPSVAPSAAVPALPSPSAASSSSASTAPAAATTTPAATTAAKPKTAAAEEPSWYETLDPMTLGGVGGIFALLLGWAVYKRKQNSDKADFADTQFDSKDGKGALLTQDGGESVDTFNSVFVSNFSDANIPMEASEVDPVAEADVYMQYGRDAHAEDILKDALKQNPNRHPVRLKLMELYASKDNHDALNEQFGVLTQLAQAGGDEWLAGKQLVDKTGGAKKAGKSTLDVPSLSKSSASTVPYSAPTMIGDVADLIEPKTQFNALPMFTAIEPKVNPSADNSKAGAGLNFHLQAPTIMASPGMSNASQNAMDDLNIDKPNSVIEFNMTLPSAPNKPSAKPIAPDAYSASGSPAGFNLGIGSAPAAASPFGSGASFFDKLNVESPSVVSNFSALETKLNLAKAYTDIGDKEGARELLQEIVEAGHQNLSEQAKALLVKL